MDDIVSVTYVHISGLQDLQNLLGSATDGSAYPNKSFSCATFLTRHRHLCLILRLPVEVFKSIEENETGEVDRTRGLRSETKGTTWQVLCPALAELSQLSSIHLWVDHIGPRTWTAVNERMFLAPVTALATILPDCIIAVNLPMLHPTWEDATRHFTPGNEPSSYTIERRIRQRLHIVPGGSERTFVHRVNDFSILFEGYDPDECLHTEAQLERSLWEMGKIVEKIVCICVSHSSMPSLTKSQRRRLIRALQTGFSGPRVR